MTYSIIKTNGSPLPVIGDAVRDDSSTSLSLVGKNYASYGIVLNENFVHLLENFANPTAPISPLEGQLWWNSTAKNLRVYSGDGWKSMVSSTAGAVQPASPAQGDQWFNTNVNQLRVWNGSTWVAIGPLSNPGIGLTGPVAESVTDTANPPQTHVVVKNYIENQVVSIVSKDATFTPASPLDGFPLISHGVTLSATYSLAPSANSLVTKQYVDSGLANASVTTGSVTPEKLSTGGPYWTASGNVGIGTNSPTAKLTVAGYISSISDASANFTLDGGNVTAAERSVYFSESGTIKAVIASYPTIDGGYMRIGNRANSYMKFETNAIERIRIDASGNVGVGTTTPGQKLSVAGTVESTSGGFKFPDGTTQTTAAGGSFTLSDGAVTPAKLSTGGPYWASTGNVGIGTTTPAAKFEVSDGTLRLALNPMPSIGYLGVITNHALGLTTNDIERLRIDTSGNVGIGTASPVARLDVLNTAAGGIVWNHFANSSGAANASVALSLDPGNNGLNTRDAQIRAINNGSNQVSMLFYTANADAPAERMRIDYSGNVGVGTSSPVMGLHLGKSAGRAVFGGIDGNNNEFLLNGNWYYNSANSRGEPITAGYQTQISLRNSTGTIVFSTSSSSVAAGSASTLTERMWVDNTGRVFIGALGAPSDPAATTMSGLVLSPTPYISISRSSGVSGAFNRTTTAGIIVNYRYNGNLVGTVSTDGASTSFNTSSDYRLKDNVQPMTGALEKIALLNPVTYTWKSTGATGQGFIAHELQEVFPDAVTGEKDKVDENGNPEYQGVDTSFLVAALAACVQELTAKVNSLEEKLRTVSGK